MKGIRGMEDGRAGLGREQLLHSFPGNGISIISIHRPISFLTHSAWNVAASWLPKASRITYPYEVYLRGAV
jgi:hypothetical protein